MPTDGVEKDYIKIAYAGSDCLYVPATALDLVSKYIGAGEDTEHTRLNKLGGTEWAKTTHRAKAAAKDLAEGLIKLYARRQREAGHAFSPDSPWQQEFEDAFDYTETDDQLQAIREIKADMEKPVPMDRLLCGDVGYGKTEVALRAVMKCILDGKQAAILVPTTVLAQQHYATAMNRFRSFPVTVEVLSRFRTPKQTKEILERAAQGKIDLLIGTHRLLAKNLVFKDLGLLIIDEEQRFGVTHKEKLRERVRQVDTLTLSATPIPRTLALVIYGDLDVSVIDQLPPGRQKVDTFALGESYRPRINAFLRKQVQEGHQVFIVCPLVGDGDTLPDERKAVTAYAKKLQEETFPDLRVSVLHGKMKPKEKEKVMETFAAGESDILVSTTVVEVGVDVPNATCMVVENAERFGLSQLHQLRGRVGRGQAKSYCILLSEHPSEETRRRLKVMTRTNNGFEISQEDLQLRGPGDFFGQRQHGLPTLKIADLACDMQLLEEAQSAARELLRRDEDLSRPEHRPLLERVRELFHDTADSMN